MLKSLFLFGSILFSLSAQVTLADSFRCDGQLVGIGDTKADVISICGSPDLTDSYCEPSTRKTHDSDDKEVIIDSCENIEMWSYKAESNGIWEHVYFSQGQVKDIRNGKRLN